jgi:hypothetical protein
MKQIVKRFVRRGLGGLVNAALDHELVAHEVHRRLAPEFRRLREELDRLREDKKLDQITAVDKQVQTLLSLTYKERLAAGAPRHAFDEVEFRCFSQNGEDGILLYLFSLLGTTNKNAVEICAGTGIECNTANLIVNHGWHGFLVDGDPENVARGHRFYAECRDTCVRAPKFVHAWVTAENVNDLVRRHGFAGDLDLVSLDIDGNDYWVWQRLDCVRPRVVVLEYHCAWGPDRAVTIPYRPDFRLDLTTHPYYAGASLAAFVKLGRQKGYRLVGAQRHGFNAFFLRAGVGEDLFPEIDAAECLGPNCAAWDWQGREWVEV